MNNTFPKIIAIKHCSAGNTTVGDMWRETKIFDPDTPVSEIIKWASDGYLVPLHSHLEITVADNK